MSSPQSEPKVLSDSRFKAGRALVRKGAGENAISMFSTLVEESRAAYGDSSLEAAACYYEYGNALFRSESRSNDEKEAEPVKSEPLSKLSKSSAAAAEKRMAASNNATSADSESSSSSSVKPIKSEDNNDDADPSQNSDDADPSAKDDIHLALELMENAYAILEERHVGSDNAPHLQYTTDQIPRVLIGIGDLFVHLGRHADAADAYTRAIPYREAAAAREAQNTSVLALKYRRLVVEANFLVAETLLSCPEGEDVVTTESKMLLVQKSERIEFARGYYDKARDELQETVYLMGRAASLGQDLGSEKEDVCFLATLLMGVGNSLADIDEAASSSSSMKEETHIAKKPKKG